MSGITLVTGGAGFVGKHLVRLLRERGERVRSFDLAPPGHEDDIQGSIVDPDVVDHAVEGVSSVFHLAGNAHLWARDNSVFDKINHLGTAMILEASRHAGVERFVHCSSLTTLVGKETRIGASTATESTRLDPDDMLGPYPKSKLLAERIVEKAADEGFDAVIALPTEPLGPGDEGITPPTKMILDFANGKTPAYIDCMLNFVPVESLAEGFIAVREKGRRGERYLLGGENVTMEKLLAMISEELGVETPKTKMPYWVALAVGLIDTGLIARMTGKPPTAPLTGVRLAGRRVAFSSHKSETQLGWRAGNVREALKATLEWARSSGLVE